MVKTVDPLKRLGELFFFPFKTTKGFVKETRLCDKTHLIPAKNPSGYNPLAKVRVKEFIEGKRDDLKLCVPGYLAKLTLVDIGKDYKGSLELPKGTEIIEIYDLNKDGSQVIHYCHRFQKDKTRLNFSYCTPFANEFRSQDNRITIKDIMPYGDDFHKALVESSVRHQRRY